MTAADDWTVPVVDYRQFINRDLPLRARACESKAMYVTRGEQWLARLELRHGAIIRGPCQS